MKKLEGQYEEKEGMKATTLVLNPKQCSCKRIGISGSQTAMIINLLAFVPCIMIKLANIYKHVCTHV